MSQQPQFTMQELNTVCKGGPKNDDSTDRKSGEGTGGRLVPPRLKDRTCRSGREIQGRMISLNSLSPFGFRRCWDKKERRRRERCGFYATFGRISNNSPRSPHGQNVSEAAQGHPSAPEMNTLAGDRRRGLRRE